MRKVAERFRDVYTNLGGTMIGGTLARRTRSSGIGLTVLVALPLACTPPPPPTPKAEPTPPTSTPRTVLIDPLLEPPAKEVPKPMEFASFKTDQGQVVKLPAVGDPWADRVVSFTIGNPKPAKATDPKGTLGKPNFGGKGKRVETSVSMGHGGELVLEFTDNVLIDGPGDDLVVFEVGAAIEGTLVDISTDGKEWVKLGRIKGAKSTIDIAQHVKPGQQFRFVRLTDAKEGKSNKSAVAGADIDAVGTINMLRTGTAKSSP